MSLTDFKELPGAPIMDFPILKVKTLILRLVCPILNRIPLKPEGNMSLSRTEEASSDSKEGGIKKTLFVCTSNAGKLREFREALGAETQVLGLKDLESLQGNNPLKFIEPPENADTFFENATTKLCAAIQHLSLVASALGRSSSSIATHVLVDDSGLCVSALEGQPGVHSATLGGLPRSDEGNRKALADALIQKGLTSSPAHFACLLLQAQIPVQPEFFQEDCWTTHIRSCEKELISIEGSVSLSEEISDGKMTVRIGIGKCLGEVKTTEQNLLPGEGHGYDSMFYAAEFNGLSFASVELAKKNKVSHRAQALRAIV